MKIYSIKEIVQATNNLYKRANDLTKNENVQNIKKENEPLILSDPIEELSSNQIENLKVSKKIKLIKKKETINIKRQSIEEIQENKKKEEIVNDLYEILKKK